MKSDTLEEYFIKETIGTGTFSKVKLGIHKKTQEKVAIKILDKKKIHDKDDLIRIKRELKIITSLNHQNVIHIIDFCDTKDFYYIIMEYCKGGELFNYIVNKAYLTDDEASYFYYQLINGIEYIHSKGVVHRDLKPENLLLDHENRLKIIDFGLSNFFDGKLLETPCGSPCYASPEMVGGHPYNGIYIDIWSTGIILFAMLCGYLPFEDDSNEILFQKIIECQLVIPSQMNADAANLLRKIVVVDPARRITINQIKEHKFYLRGKEIYLAIERQINERNNIHESIENNMNYIPVHTEYSTKLNKGHHKVNSKKKQTNVIMTTASNINKEKKRPFSTEHADHNSKDQIVHTCSSVRNTFGKDAGPLNGYKISQEWLKSLKTIRKKSNKNNKTSLVTNNYKSIQSKRIKTSMSNGSNVHHINKHNNYNSNKKSFSNMSTNSSSQKPVSKKSSNPKNNNHSIASKNIYTKLTQQIQFKNRLNLNKVNQCLSPNSLNKSKYKALETRNDSPHKHSKDLSNFSCPKNPTKTKQIPTTDKDSIQRQINYLLTEGIDKKQSNINNLQLVDYFACPTVSNKTNRYLKTKNPISNFKSNKSTQKAKIQMNTSGKIENLFFKGILFQSPTYK